MDREIKESYQVMIQAKDMGGQLGGLAGTTTVNITLTDVNDNPPRFAKSMSRHLHKLPRRATGRNELLHSVMLPKIRRYIRPLH